MAKLTKCRYMTDWDAFVDEIGPKLFAYFKSRFNDSSASDLTQETLIRLVDKHQSGVFDVKKGSLAMYAFGIAKYVRLEAIKSNVKHDHLELEDHHSEMGKANNDKVEERDQLFQLRQAISQLPEPQQEIILLQINEDLGLKEIGELMAMPTGTVKSHIHRAKQNLINLMN